MKNRFIILLLCLLAVGCKGKGEETPAAGDVTQERSNLPSCGSDPLFTVSPIPLEEISGIVPLGNINPPAHTFPTDHLYIGPKCTFVDHGDWTEWDCVKAKVYSPGHIFLTSVSENTYSSSGEVDYEVYFSPCKEVGAYYMHVMLLTNGLLSQIGSFPKEDCFDGGHGYTKCPKTVNIELAAGDLIGEGQDGTTLDFGAYDARAAPLAYANPDRYYKDPYLSLDQLHAVCPIDYYPEDLRSQLFGKFNRTVEPKCGEVEQDEPGTAQGNWFLPGTEGTFSAGNRQLALVHDNADPAKAVFSIGVTSGLLVAGYYYFDPTSSGSVNREFSQVTADGSLYCYGPLEYYDHSANQTEYRNILIQLTSATTLRIEMVESSGSGCVNPPWTFGSDCVDFER